jgi:hypothetical protein
MKKTAIILFVVFVCNIATAQEVPKIRIDPSKSFGGTISEYFDSIEYIPLETTKESLFGYVVQMVVTDSSIIISDFDTKAVFFFTKQGKFMQKVKTGTAYPNIDYNRVNRYLTIRSVDENDKPIEKYYSITGHPLEQAPEIIKIPKSKIVMPLGDGYYIKPNFCAIWPGQKPADTAIYLAQIYKQDTLVKSFIPIIAKEKIAACSFFTVNELSPPFEGGAVYMATPVDHEVYRITKDTAIKTYQFIFSADRSFSRRITESKDFKFIDSLRKETPENVNVVIKVNNIFKYKDVLFFRIITRRNGSDRKIGYDDTFNFIYNLNTGKLSCIERMLPDSSNGFLPFYGWGITMFGLNYNKDDDRFYTNVSSLEMFQAYAENKPKKPTYPISTIEYFKTQNRKANPVIVSFKLKK